MFLIFCFVCKVANILLMLFHVFHYVKSVINSVLDGYTELDCSTVTGQVVSIDVLDTFVKGKRIQTLSYLNTFKNKGKIYLPLSTNKADTVLVPKTLSSHNVYLVIPRRRQRDIDLALSVRLFVCPDVRPSVRHKLVGAISERLLHI